MVEKIYTKDLNESYKVDGIVINLDDSRFLWPNQARASSMTIEDAYIYIDQYIGDGSHVTDLVLTANTTFMSMFDSEVWEDQLDKYNATEELGVPVDFKNTQAAVLHHYSEELGVDVWKLWIDHIREKGVNPWISFRMCDHHEHKKNGPLTAVYFWERYEKMARVLHRDNNNYRGDRCLDYAYREVRDYWLAYIEEAVTKYDLYGIELDWMRDPIFTSLGNELSGSGMLTEFMSDVKSIVTKSEAKWGHKIYISVRCARDIQTCIDAGFDIPTWCAKGILDWVCPSSYFMSDSEIPVLTWKKILAPYNVKLVPNITQFWFSTVEGIRNISDIPYYSHVYKPGISAGQTNIDTVAGAAYSYIGQGADKVYIFNIFGDCSDPITAKDKYVTDKIYPIGCADTGKEERTITWNMLCNVGSYEKMAKRRRRLTLCYQDYAGLWGTPQHQIPVTVDRAYKYRYLHFYTGDVKNDKLTLRLGVVGEADISDAMEVFVNGKLVKYTHREENIFPYQPEGTLIYCFDVDTSVINGSAVVEFTTKDKNVPYTVEFAELLCDAK